MVISIDTDKTNAEEYALKDVMQKAMELRESLNESQLMLFSSYVNSLSNYHTVSNKESFFKGITLAISLFSDNFEKN